MKALFAAADAETFIVGENLFNNGSTSRVTQALDDAGSWPGNCQAGRHEESADSGVLGGGLMEVIRDGQKACAQRNFVVFYGVPFEEVPRGIKMLVSFSRIARMTFDFLHSTHQEAPILIPRIGLTLRVRVPADTTGGVLTAIETVNEPGFGPPLHRHRETEIFYVLEGRYLFEVNGERFNADVGDVITVPGGATHAFVNITDKPARQYIQILPGLDAAAFFLGLGDVMRTGKLDPDALNAFGSRWRIEFLGPPLKTDKH